MHFLCCPFGSSGDVHPTLGLALALKDRGHRVTIAASAYFRALIERFGLDYDELGTTEEFLELTRQSDIWHPLRALPTIFRSGVMPLMRRHYELIERYHRQACAVGGSSERLITITNVFGFGALVAQEKLGIPAISLHLQPSVIWSDHAPPEIPGGFGPKWMRGWQFRVGERFVIDRSIRPALNAWRAELGLEPVQRVARWWHSPAGIACLFPDWFAPPQPDWPRPLLQTGFPLWDERFEDDLPAPVAEFLQGGEPPIVFTPGSANLHGQAFFDAAIRVTQQLGRRAILLTRFPEQLPNVLPEGIAHFGYVPFSQVLPHAAGLVHHGGVGSMSQAMAAGIPQVIVALAHDQFDNTHRVRRLGVGDGLKHSQLRVDRLAAMLRRNLDDPAVLARCQELSQRLQGQAGRGLPAMAPPVGIAFCRSVRVARAANVAGV
jgi:rhamnosyltransferase subunit B